MFTPEMKRRFLPGLIGVIALGIMIAIASTSTSLSSAQEGGISSAYLPLILTGPDGGEPCAALQHDPNQWHPLLDAETNCHFNHEHKHDPNQVNDLFGPPGAWFGGTSISYPWQTLNENQGKHEAYSWVVRRDIPSLGRELWLKAFRIQSHVTGTPFSHDDGTLHGGYLGRFHSFSLEAQICHSSGSCGIVRTGGWIDFGNLEISGVGPVPLPGEEEAVADNGRRRIHYDHPDPERRYLPQLGAPFFWYGRQRPDSAPYADVLLNPILLAFSSTDTAVNVEPDRLYDPIFFCPEYDCNKNDSTIQAHVVQLSTARLAEVAGTDENGLVTFAGYTNRWGEQVGGCTTVSLECIPLIAEGAPVGQVQHRDDTHLVDHPNNGYDDFDTSPPGEWWIDYPN